MPLSPASRKRRPCVAEPVTIPAVVVRRVIEASAEDLFDAWLDPASLAVWMRPTGIARSEARTDPRVGGSYEVLMHTATGALRHTGTYRVIERPRRLVFTWSSPATQQTDSLVTVEFNATPHGTELVLTHQKLPDLAALPSHNAGWTSALALLDAHWGKAAGAPSGA